MTLPIGREREFIEKLNVLVAAYEDLPPAQIVDALVNAAHISLSASVAALRSVDYMLAERREKVSIGPGYFPLD